MIRELLLESWAGIMAHRTRSLLSGLGILFGVSAVLGILSIGEGGRQEQQALIERLGVSNFQVRQRPLPEDSEVAKEVQRRSRGLSLQDSRALQEVLPDVVSVGGLRDGGERHFVPKPREPVAVYGLEPSYLSATRLELAEGRWLSQADEEQSAAVCLLGAHAARLLFPGQEALGKTLRLDQTWLRVVGIVEEPGGGQAEVGDVSLWRHESAVMLPLSTLQERVEGRLEYGALDAIQVALGDVSQVEGSVEVAQRLLTRLHRQQDDFSLIVPIKMMLQAQAQQRIFNTVMGLIAGISLLVGGIGVMNIMLASVLERTSEIGLRLAIGATPRDIQALFLGEAALLSLLGGLLGIAGGLLISWGVSLYTGWTTSVHPLAILAVVLLSVLEGLVFGFLPARRAAQLPPSMALRGGG